jgi:lipid-binding SYLF domain-containing protein
LHRLRCRLWAATLTTAEFASHFMSMEVTVNSRTTSIRAALAAFFVAAGGLALAATPADIDAGVAGTLDRFYAQDQTHRDLTQKAAAVLVFPEVTKAGAGVGGEYGKGALEVSGRTVGYYKITGASVGATLGAARRSEVILFMTDAARDKFMHSHDWSIGADTGVAVAHKGAGADYEAGRLNKPVLAFVFGEKGLIADASLEGAKISRLPQQ